MLIQIIAEVMNNTFIGTLFAGLILACFGIFLGENAYRNQKNIDIEHEKNRKLIDLASDLYSSIEMAAVFFRGQLNINDSDSNNLISEVNSLINLKNSNFLHKKSVDKANQYAEKIQDQTNELISHIKANDFNLDVKTNELNGEIAKFSVYILTVSVINNSNSDELDEYRKKFDNITSIIKICLESIIKNK